MKLSEKDAWVLMVLGILMTFINGPKLEHLRPEYPGFYTAWIFHTIGIIFIIIGLVSGMRGLIRSMKKKKGKK